MKIDWSRGKENFKDPSFVREAVFIKEQNVPKEIELDEFDSIAHHIVIYEDQKPIAAGRLLETENYYSIGRVSVLKEYRGQDYGKLIMENILNKASALGANEVQLHAQLHAKKFYEQLGFTSFGELFVEAEIDHICMRKYL